MGTDYVNTLHKDNVQPRVKRRLRTNLRMDYARNININLNMRTLLVLAMLFVGNVYGQKVNLETKVKPTELELYLVQDLEVWDFHGNLVKGKLVKEKDNESMLFLNYELADCIVFVEYDIVVKTILQLDDRIITTQFLEEEDKYERRKLLD